jgi:poly-gamma-glutamate synthesis protein (capsule biosynthesis protein)
MKELQNICSKLQLWSAVFQDGKEVDIFRAGLDTTRWKFVIGNEPGVSTKCHEQDFKGNIVSVKNARRQADYVLVAYHGHEFVQDNAIPAKFQIEFARACVDAGADVYLGNGPHQLRGIEIYKGKPIFYGLGSFVTHSRYITRFPADGYERVGLSPEATPMDYLKTRYRFHTDEGYNMYAGGPGGEPEIKGKESVIVLCTFYNGLVVGLKLYPIWLSDKPQSQKPFALAAGDKAKSIIDDLREMSSKYGTTIEYKDGAGIVKIEK